MNHNYAINIMKAVTNFKHKKTVLSNYPQIDGIEPTNHCNLNCWFCARAQAKKRGIGFMSYSTFKNIVNFKNRLSLAHPNLFGHGEPLLKPDFVDLLHELKKYSGSVSFNTNATLLRGNLQRQILECDIDNIDISFEGVNKQVYEDMRLGAKFEAVENNILSFILLRNRMKSKTKITLVTIVCDETKLYLKEFIKKWKNYADKIILNPLNNWGGLMSWEDNTIKPKICFAPWYSIFFNYSGDAVPCCVYEGKNFLGNINDKTLNEIWNSKEYQWFRWCHLYNRELLDQCRDCDFNAYMNPYFGHIGEPNRFFPVDRCFLGFGKEFMIKHVVEGD